MTNSPPPSTTAVVKGGQTLSDFLRSFWQHQVDTAEQETPDYRHPPLPLARIKKVMKSDPDVKMIAADAPVLFCKACEIFIAEITARAFIIADSNKRRTLSRSDISKALSKSDQFDFLIDIVPREDAPFNVAAGPGSTLNNITLIGAGAGAGLGASRASVIREAGRGGRTLLDTLDMDNDANENQVDEILQGQIHSLLSSGQ